MSIAIRPRTATGANTLTAGKLPRGTAWWLLVVSWVIFTVIFLLLKASGATANFNIVGALFFGTVLFDVLIVVISRIVEGGRKAKDRLITSLVTTAFIVTLLPLVSLIYTVISRGVARFDPMYFGDSMRNVISVGGGAFHAIIGTLEITAAASIISIPIGLLTSVYLVEYGRGHLANGIRFFVDVMTGIPSIVAGLFAYSLFTIIFGPAFQAGIVGAVALSVLMIPVIVRSSEEILKIVPNELREASYALGVPKWLTIMKIILPTSIDGLTTGVMLAISRVIGETAPLLLTTGFTTSTNFNLFSDKMMTLPVFVYTQYSTQGPIPAPYVDRSWTGALVLILIVMLLNLVARLVGRAFAPKFKR